MGKHSKLKEQVESGPDIQEAWVDAPLTTWAQYLHEVESGSPRAGRERVQVDRRTLLGGFCRFHGTQAQEQAAARFKAIYERSQVGGAKAVDPSREPVDGGGINPESVIEIGADARRAYNEMVAGFGKTAMRQLEFVIIGDKGPTAYARWMNHGRQQSGQVVGRCAADFRRLVEHLSVHLKLQNRVAKGEPK